MTDVITMASMQPRLRRRHRRRLQ